MGGDDNGGCDNDDNGGCDNDVFNNDGCCCCCNPIHKYCKMVQISKILVFYLIDCVSIRTSENG